MKSDTRDFLKTRFARHDVRLAMTSPTQTTGNATAEETLWYYRSLVEAFRRRDVIPRLAEELNRVVTELEELVGK